MEAPARAITRCAAQAAPPYQGKTRTFGGDARAGIGDANPRQILGPALLHDRRRGRRASGRAASAGGTTSLNTRAPSEPPRTSRRIVVSGREIGTAASAAIAERTGLPVTGATLGKRSVAAKLSASWSASRAKKRFAPPQHGVLLVQDHRPRPRRRGEQPAPAGRKDSRRNRRSPLNVRARMRLACTTPPASARGALPTAHRTTARDTRAADGEPLEPSKTGLCTSGRARIRHQHNAVAAFGERLTASASAGKKWPPVRRQRLRWASHAGPLIPVPP